MNSENDSTSGNQVSGSLKKQNSSIAFMVI